MATIKSYTDLEQSKRLAEFLSHDSADMGYLWNGTSFCKYPVSNQTIFKRVENIPCWSLSALINLLPSEFTTENKFGIFKYTIRIRKYKFTEDEDVYQIAYGNYKYYEDGSSSWKDMINTGEKEELLDAVFDMICWLKENEKI